MLIPAVRDRIIALGSRDIDESRDVLSASSTAWPSDSTFVEVLPRVALGPFAWETTFLPLPLMVDALAWFLLVTLTVVGVVVMKRRSFSLLLILPAVALLVSLVVTSGNYGTMQRLRLQAAIFLIPLAGQGVSWLIGRIRKPIVGPPSEATATPDGLPSVRS